VLFDDKNIPFIDESKIEKISCPTVYAFKFHKNHTFKKNVRDLGLNRFCT
jgi:hypothetical protein